MSPKLLGPKLDRYCFNPKLPKHCDFYQSFLFNGEKFQVGEFALFKDSENPGSNKVGRLLCVCHCPKSVSEFKGVVRWFAWAGEMESSVSLNIKLHDDEVIEESPESDTIISLEDVQKKYKVIFTTLDDLIYSHKNNKHVDTAYCRYRISQDLGEDILMPFISEETLTNTEDYVVDSDSKLELTPNKSVGCKRKTNSLVMLHLDSEGSDVEDDGKIASPANPSKNIKLTPKSSDKSGLASPLKRNSSVKRVLHDSFDTPCTSPSGIPVFSCTVSNSDSQQIKLTFKLEDKRKAELKVHPTKLGDEILESTSPLSVKDLQNEQNCIKLSPEPKERPRRLTSTPYTPNKIGARRRSSRNVGRKSYAELSPEKSTPTRKGRGASSLRTGTPAKESYLEVIEGIKDRVEIELKDQNQEKSTPKRRDHLASASRVGTPLKEVSYLKSIEEIRELVEIEIEDEDSEDEVSPGKSNRVSRTPKRYVEDKAEACDDSEVNFKDKRKSAVSLTPGRPKRTTRTPGKGSNQDLTALGNTRTPRRYIDDDGEDLKVKRTNDLPLALGRPKRIPGTPKMYQEESSTRITRSSRAGRLTSHNETNDFQTTLKKQNESGIKSNSRINLIESSTEDDTDVESQKKNQDRLKKAEIGTKTPKGAKTPKSTKGNIDFHASSNDEVDLHVKKRQGNVKKDKTLKATKTSKTSKNVSNGVETSSEDESDLDAKTVSRKRYKTIKTPKRSTPKSKIEEKNRSSTRRVVLIDDISGDEIDTYRKKRSREKEETRVEAGLKTPKGVKTPRSAKKDTPSARARLIREGVITPSMHARGKAVVKDSTPLSKARIKLHVSFLPKTLPCREKEFEDIINFLEGKLLDGCGGCMYVSGVPGTGKTATVTEVINTLQQSVKSGDVPGFTYVNINGMRLSEPRQAYVEIMRQLTGKTMHWEQAQSSLETKFTKVRKKTEPIVLVVDELDILCTKRQDVVYNLLDWPTKANAQLIVVTIANTMDLPERLLMGRVTSRLGLTRLTFQAYTFKQLQEIVTQRLTGLGAFNPNAIQLVARKVASVSGDARRALDICRRAAEIAEAEGNDTLVGMGHVNQALNAMITQPKVQAIKHCARLEKLILQAVVAEVERTGVEETSFVSVLRMLVSIAALDGFPMVSNTVAMAAVYKLGACRLLLIDQKCSNIYLKIILNVSADDVYYALNKTDV